MGAAQEPGNSNFRRSKEWEQRISAKDSVFSWMTNGGHSSGEIASHPCSASRLLVRGSTEGVSSDSVQSKCKNPSGTDRIGFFRDGSRIVI